MMMHMDITPRGDTRRRDRAAAAETGGPEIKQAAERLTLTLEPSARLALMEAISQAASEITTEMRSGGVDVRLNGRELDFVVETTPVNAPTPPPPPAPPTPEEAEEEGGL